MTDTETPAGGMTPGDGGEQSPLYQLAVDLETLSTRLGTLAGAAAALGDATDHHETRGLCRMAYAASFTLEALERTADDLVRRAGAIYRQEKGGAA